MAALSTKTVARLSRQHVAPAVSVVMVSRRHQSNLAAYKRGSGGRSSFSGLVTTVFGASGFVGKAVVNRLGKIGTQIIVPYRSDPYFQRDLKLAGDLGQVLFTEFNLKDEESIYTAMKYSNVVINLLERDHETKNWSFDALHVNGARKIARIAKEVGVQKLVHVSHLLASPNPQSIYIKGGSKYLKAKFAGEMAVREEFPEACIIRPADVAEKYVPYYASPFRRSLGTIPLWNKGEDTIRMPVFRSSLAEGIVNAVRDPDSDGRIYECVGPEGYYLSDLIDYFIQLQRRQEWTQRGLPNPFFRLKMMIVQHPNVYTRFKSFYPQICMERWEREHLNEYTTGRNPTLEDLGVTQVRLEDRMPWEWMPYHFNHYYEDKVGEVPDPVPPPTVDERRQRERDRRAFV